MIQAARWSFVLIFLCEKVDEEVSKLEDELYDEALHLPNATHPDVPPGPEANAKLMRHIGSIPDTENKRDHVSIGSVPDCGACPCLALA